MSATAAIHVAKKQLGLDDETMRDVYQRVTGKRSLRDMSSTEQNNVVQELRRSGFKPASTGSRNGLEGKYAAKLQALWISAWNLGIVNNKDDRALIAFAQRQTGLSHVRFLRDADDAAKAIEALKAWMTREAGVEWRDTVDTAYWQKLPGAQVALAQWQILFKAGVMAERGKDFRSIVAQLAKPLDQMMHQDWPVVMNALGEQIRKTVAK